jgi:uncharacterized protein
MKGALLRFYVHEFRKHDGRLLYEWMLERAREAGIHGGSAFRAIAGFGRHGVLHEQRFFELAADLTVEVEFVVSEAEADRLLEMVAAAGIETFYTRVAAEFGLIAGKG